MNPVSVLTIVLLTVNCAFAWNAFGVDHHRHEEKLSLSEEFLQGSIEQPFDHFDNNENRTFKMTFYIRRHFFKPNGPIYLWVGAQDGVDARSLFIDNNLINQLARETHGAMVTVNQRYYFDNELEQFFTDFKFLNVPQTLADVAEVIKSIKSRAEYQSSKVVVLGNWFGGSLATWMRLKYPELVDAAVASSAPLLATKDYQGHLDIFRSSLEKYGTPDCIQTLEKCLETYEKISSVKGSAFFYKSCNVCDDDDYTLKENQGVFYQYIYNAFLMGNQTDTCNNSLCYPGVEEEKRQPCRSIEFDVLFDPQTISTDDFAKYYQACHEFGDFMTFPSTSPFVHPLSKEWYLKACKNLFGDSYNEGILDEGIARLNREYGGLTPNVSQVVFTFAETDPWRPLGVQQDLSPSAPARVFQGRGSIMLDGSSSPQLEAIEFVKSTVKKFIGLS